MADRSERLAIVVTASDLASGKLSKVRGELGKMNTSGKAAAIGLGSAMKVTQSGEKALQHLGGRLTQLAGPLGFIGLAGGAIGLTSALTGSIDKASEFGKASEDLAKITGLNIAQASSLVDVLDKYGIAGDAQIKTVGMLEKNVGNLTATSKGYKAFLGEYGVSLKAANGRTLDANALLLKASDYFNGTADASKKASLMGKLFGKSWQDLIPVLSLGSKGIQQETRDAVHLTDTQLSQLGKFRKAQREWGDSLGDLQTLIGVDLMPSLTDGLSSATAWLEGHRDDVRKFFTDGLETARGMASVVTGTVVPAFQSLAGSAKAFWDGIPAPLRDFLVKGVIADRTIKFLFGISPIHLAVDLAEKGLSTVVGAILRNIAGGVVNVEGAVVNVAGGGVPGAGSVPGALPKGAGLLTALGLTVGTLVPLTVGLIAAAGLTLVLDKAINDNGGLKTAGDKLRSQGLTLGPTSVAQDPSLAPGRRVFLGGKGGSLLVEGPTVPQQHVPGLFRRDTTSVNAAQDAAEKAQQARNAGFTTNPTRNELRTQIGQLKEAQKRASVANSKEIGVRVAQLQTKLDRRIESTKTAVDTGAAKVARAVDTGWASATASVWSAVRSLPTPQVNVSIPVTISPRTTGSAIVVNSIRSGNFGPADHPGGGGA